MASWDKLAPVGETASRISKTSGTSWATLKPVATPPQAPKQNLGQRFVSELKTAGKYDVQLGKNAAKSLLTSLVIKPFVMGPSTPAYAPSGATLPPALPQGVVATPNRLTPALPPRITTTRTTFNPAEQAALKFTADELKQQAKAYTSTAINTATFATGARLNPSTVEQIATKIATFVPKNLTRSALPGVEAGVVNTTYTAAQVYHETGKLPTPKELAESFAFGFAVGSVGHLATRLGVQPPQTGPKELPTEIPPIAKGSKTIPTIEDLKNLKTEPKATVLPEKIGAITPASQKTLEAFNKSTRQTLVDKNIELGSFGRNASERKADLGDRFPESQLADTLKQQTAEYRGSNDPSNYRYDNVVRVSKMPDGELRAIYTRENVAGKQEIINWHTISKPEYLDTLKQNGVPTGTRTPITPLEGESPVRLNDRNASSLPEKAPKVKAADEVITVPKSQLPVVSEGAKKRISRLEERVATTLGRISEEDRAQLSTYDVMNKPATIKKASEFVELHTDEALDILLGRKPALDDIPTNALYIALTKKEGVPADLITKVASLRATRGGQEMSILTELDPHSEWSYAAQLAQRKLEVRGGKETVLAIREKDISSGEKSVRKSLPKKDAWSDFLEQIKC